MLVATAATASVMDAYALIKSLGQCPGRIGVLINQASPAAAAESFERVAAACQRFLKRPVEPWGRLPAIEELDGRPAEPAAQADAEDGLQSGIQWLARQLKTGAKEHTA